MSDDPNTSATALIARIAMLSLAAICLVFAIIHIRHPEYTGLDETTLKFLALAVVALLAPQITKFKGFGVEFEQLAQIKESVKNVQASVGGLEKNLGPGSKSAVTSASVLGIAPSFTRGTEGSVGTVDPDDPNKGQFGGSAETADRKLSARIRPEAGPGSSRCRVTITVSSKNPAKPMSGKVKLHLHPTFGRWSSYDVDVKDGMARDEIVSYGAFTIGAVADNGDRLELDLMDVPGGTDLFYKS